MSGLNSAAELAQIPVAKCVLLKRNPQYLTPHEMEGLKRSIERDGFVAPILVRPMGDQYEVVSGNHRLMAAMECGFETVPSVIADLSDEQTKRLAVNLNTVHGSPTAELMAPFLADLDDELLRSIHIDDELMQDVLKLDKDLADRLKKFDVPDEFNQASVVTPLPRRGDQKSCPKCGAPLNSSD